MEKKWMLIIQGLTLFAVVVSWGIVPSCTEQKRREAEIGIWQHSAMSDAHRNVATALGEIQQYVREKTSQYECAADALSSEMTDEELNKLNQLMNKMNAGLRVMYMVMPDNKYQSIQDSIPLRQPTKSTVQLKKLLVAMRKSQFPGTGFSTTDDIRTFDLFERPKKKVEKQQ